MIELADLHFEYGGGGFALNVPGLKVDRGQSVAFLGPSGSGKTTLMYLISGILSPDSGSVAIDGTVLSALSDSERRKFRISRFGFIFQEFRLLEYLGMKENILLPYRINQSLKLTPEVRDSVDSLAETVGLGGKLARHPHELSHGEQQRVAICRALITQPDIIIADEPTSSLDPKNTAEIMNIVSSHARERQATVLMLTHDRSLLEAFDRVIDIRSFAQGEGK